jgi:hypothetical protein
MARRTLNPEVLGSIPGGTVHRLDSMLGAQQACQPFGVGYLVPVSTGVNDPCL